MPSWRGAFAWLCMYMFAWAAFHSHFVPTPATHGTPTLLEKHRFAASRPALPAEAMPVERLSFCKHDPWREKGLERSFDPYIAPHNGLTLGERAGRIVFIHLPKSGGTSVRNALRIGSRRGFLLWRKSWPEFVTRNTSHVVKVAGTNSFGACEKLGVDGCAYLTVMREPVARCLSSYRYHCLDGAEGRKGWAKGWTRCNATILSWAMMNCRVRAVAELSVNNRPRQTNKRQKEASCIYLQNVRDDFDVASHLEAAKANIRSGLVRVAILEDLVPSLRRTGLSDFIHLEDLSHRANDHTKHRDSSGARVAGGGNSSNLIGQKLYADNPDSYAATMDSRTMAELRNIIYAEIQLYELALKIDSERRHIGGAKF